MSRQAFIDDALRDELRGVAASAGCELLHVELKGSVLRLVLDREEGVSVDDCARVSRQVSALLDVVEFDPGHYTLEVSSPGLDRPIYRPEEYGRFIGRLARVTYDATGEGGKRTVVGRLTGFDGDAGVVTLAEAGAPAPLELPLDRILRARLEIEL
ncbi:MAG TPA: ribosome maturation factor RimP [Thermoanaerobaculia bacterium]|nr:ribosome maturation factor RimP [Thermoanaerobaculia bacterium]